MLDRRHFLAASVLALAVLPAAALAASPVPFTADAFAKAQQAQKPILIHVHADWCPTCRAQIPAILGLESNPDYKNLVVFKVDFDAQREVLAKFGVRSQSTLIVFKGGAEAGRSVGVTNPAAIEALARQAL